MILINASPRDALKIFQPFFPISMPVSIGVLLAVLEEQGIPAKFIDQQIEDDVIGRVAEMIPGLKRPYIFGFSVLTATCKQALETARGLKERYPDSVVVFGGVHPTAVPDEVLGHREVDLVVRGEADLTLPALYHGIKNGTDYFHLENLSFRAPDGTIVHNPRGEIIRNLDALPPFPYHLFEPYQDRYNLGFVVSSRGCPYNCIFCSNRITTGKTYRYRCNEKVLAEIELLRTRYGIRQLGFLDDNLLVNRRRIHRLTEMIREKGFHRDMTFGFQGRGDNFDRELLTTLYASGFTNVFFGLETASERLMKVVDKGETVESCVAAARLAKELGYYVSATFIFALPQETHEDRLDAICLAKELNLDMVRFNNATPYPGTALWDMARREGRMHVQGEYENFVSVSTFIENPFRKIPFTYVPPGQREAEIRTDILVGYLAFYLSWRRIKSIFTRGHKEGPGWFSTGSRLVERLKKVPAIVVLGGMLSLKFGELLFNLLVGRNTQLGIREFLRIMTGRRKSPLYPRSVPFSEDKGAGAQVHPGHSP